MCNRVFLAGLVLILALASTAGCAASAANEVLVRVHVLTDEPSAPYQLMQGTPDSVGVYEFYLENPDFPGSGAFKDLDTIPLEKLNDNEFHGTKSVAKIDGALCIGYPATNFIDGKACVAIDQSQNEVDITVHYWEVGIAVAGKGS